MSYELHTKRSACETNAITRPYDIDHLQFMISRGKLSRPQNPCQNKSHSLRHDIIQALDLLQLPLPSLDSF